MLKLFKNRKLWLKKKQPKKIQPQLEKERSKIYVAERKANLPKVYSKHLTFNAGTTESLNKYLIKKINKLHNKQMKHGLSKREKTLLAEYTKHLKTIASSRDGNKRINIED